MGMIHTPESKYSQEMRKWEAQHTVYGAPGRPYTYQEYPVMLSKATHPSGGGPPQFDELVAADDQQERNLNSRGYVRGRDHAVEILGAQDREFAKLAAEREYEKQRHSAKAVAEIERIEDVHSDHLPVIEQRPIKRRVPRAQRGDAT